MGIFRIFYIIITHNKRKYKDELLKIIIFTLVYMKNKTIENFLGITIAFAAGIVNGLLGTGGGIILVFWLAFVMKSDRGYSPRDVFATVISIVLPMSLVSLWVYASDGGIDFGNAAEYLLPGVAGGVSGAFLLNKINVKLLKKIFAVMVIYAGIKMLF